MLVKEKIASLDDVGPAFRTLYVEAECGFVLNAAGRVLADEFNPQGEELERRCADISKETEPKIAEAKSLLACAKQDQEFDAAFAELNVAVKWYAALKALLRDKLEGGRPIESVVKEFLDSEEGEPYRPKREVTPFFSSRLGRT